MSESKHCNLTHQDSDIDFSVYYDFNEDTEEVKITGLYIQGSHADLAEVISDEVREDLINDIIYEVEGL